MPEEEKKEKKKRKKEKKNADGTAIGAEGSEAEEEKFGSKLLLVFVTILIIAIWLAIIALLIKMDVGGFGSSVLSPILKNVPYVSKILPDSDEEQVSEEDSQYGYTTIEDAVARIKELELELTDAQETKKEDDDTIASLQNQILDLSKYKEEQDSFELLKEKFYEEVVFGDDAPDIEEYKTYYESIDPSNAEVLYKQVVEQSSYNSEMQDYVQTYSAMKAKDAAAIFDEMMGDAQLVADILDNMDAQSRGDILAKMDKENAAKLTEILEPSK
jgi:flagellar motility protein MotE (MotC chaperone)